MTLADKFTLARLFFAPIVVVAYLLLPLEYAIVFWAVAVLGAIAELTDLFDGKIARARNEVSDFGKLADPFCDVFYRLAIFMVFLLPVGGVGWQPVDGQNTWLMPLMFAEVLDNGDTVLLSGTVPFIPVLLMVLREVVAGALRSMSATKGLVLAARSSGKIKAWIQGATLITAMALPGFWLGTASWQLYVISVMTWLCAIASVGSMAEYLWVNRAILRQLAERKKSRNSLIVMWHGEQRDTTAMLYDRMLHE